jgi:hypothetical protein
MVTLGLPTLHMVHLSLDTSLKKEITKLLEQGARVSLIYSDLRICETNIRKDMIRARSGEDILILNLV